MYLKDSFYFLHGPTAYNQNLYFIFDFFMIFKFVLTVEAISTLLGADTLYCDSSIYKLWMKIAVIIIQLVKASRMIMRRNLEE